MSVLKYRKPDGSIGTLGTPASSYVTSVNGKSGAVTGLYDSDNPPPYPVTSVNDQTGDVIVDRLYSDNKEANIRQINPDDTHIRLFYSQSTFNDVLSVITAYISPDDKCIHIGLKQGDGAWYDQVLYTTKNPPKSSSSSIAYALVTTELVGGSNNRHIVYYDQLPGISDESINSIISVMPAGTGSYYLRPKYYSSDAFELSVYGELTDVDYQIDVKIIYEV